MTTIAYRDGVIAADTQFTWCDVYDGEGVKVARRGSVFAAASGAATRGQTFMDWFRSGMPGSAPFMGNPDSTDWANGLLLVGERVVTFGPCGVSVVSAPYYALGSGREFALGAMAMGADPEQAVRVAMRFDIKTGGQVTVLRSGDGA